jgi:hypothetical protein
MKLIIFQVTQIPLFSETVQSTSHEQGFRRRSRPLVLESGLANIRQGIRLLPDSARCSILELTAMTNMRTCDAS